MSIFTKSTAKDAKSAASSSSWCRLPGRPLHTKGATADRNSQWRGAYGRVGADGAAGTLLTTMALSGRRAVMHYEGDRFLSPREAARLQGFPDSFDLGVDAAVRRAVVAAAVGRPATVGPAEAVRDAYHVVGNAVPPPLGEALARAVGEARGARERRDY